MSRLFSWFLNAGYLAMLVALAPAIGWVSWRTGKYREGYAEKLLGLVPVCRGNRPCIWLHAVSVGEVNLLATTLAELSNRRRECEIVISTTTKTGYDLARKKYGGAHTVFYCPLDFSWAVRRAMERVRPELLVLAELELWPNLIAAAKEHGAKVAIINGRLSEKSFQGYRRLRPLVRRVLQQVDLIAAQDETTAERFSELGAANISVTGSLKYDGAETDPDNPRTTELRQLAGFAAEDVVLLAGSTQSPEEAICLSVFSKLREAFPQLRLVLVPRHPERFDEVASLLEETGQTWIRRTELHSAIRPGALGQPAIVLVDCVGELSAWWGAAAIGFVGGSFGDRGGQNMIEPAAYGVATCFGPNTRNFRDIVAALLAAEGAEVVADERALETFVRRCLEDASYRQALGSVGQSFVQAQIGATARTVALLEGLLTHSPASETTRAA